MRVPAEYVGDGLPLNNSARLYEKLRILMSDDPTKGRTDLIKTRKAYEDMRQKYLDKPGFSVATLRATAKLVKDTYLEGRIGRFHFTCDEPPERGGEDQAPSPLEYFMIGAAF
jgi:hypothetical protein